MTKAEEKPDNEGIVPIGTRGLTVKASSLVARGVRDLSLRSHWYERQLFTGRRVYLGLSRIGQVCTYSKLPSDHGHRLEIHSIPHDDQLIGFDIPSAPMKDVVLHALWNVDDVKGDFLESGDRRVGWSADGRYLTIPLGPPEFSLRIFDLREKLVLLNETLFTGDADLDPGYLAWSDEGQYIAAASVGRWLAPLRLLELSTVVTPPRIEQRSKLAEIERVGYMKFYGPFCGAAFNPSGTILATCIEGEVFFLAVPALGVRGSVDGSFGPEMSWTRDGRGLICIDGDEDSVVRIDVESLTSIPIQIRARLIRCNPKYDLCAFYFSEFVDAHGSPLQDFSTESFQRDGGPFVVQKLFITDTDSFRCITEWGSVQVMDMQWSNDGNKLYVISDSGRGYVFRLPGMGSDPPLNSGSRLADEEGFSEGRYG